MRVEVSSHLFEYTAGERVLEAHGATVRELIDDLETRHPRLRFRIVDEQGRLRTHMRVFVDTRSVRDLDTPLAGVTVVHLLGALSGG
jgi:molybdopterin converting factor small subunit